MIDADPRPGYQPRQREAKLLPKFRFRVWIDKADEEWVKLDAQCIDTVSVGWFIARVHKGSRVLIEQTRVNDEVWLPKSIALKLDARILLKGVNLDEEVSYRDYKKFRTDTTRHRARARRSGSETGKALPAPGHRYRSAAS